MCSVDAESDVVKLREIVVRRVGFCRRSAPLLRITLAC